MTPAFPPAFCLFLRTNAKNSGVVGAGPYGFYFHLYLYFEIPYLPVVFFVFDFPPFPSALGEGRAGVGRGSGFCRVALSFFTAYLSARFLLNSYRYGVAFILPFLSCLS